MREILKIAMEQLWRLAVLGPAWLLTPQGRKTLFSAKTLRRVLLSVAFTLILVGVAQTLPFDLALIFAGDVLTYAEVAAIAWIASANGVLTAALKAAVHAVRPALQSFTRAGPGGRRAAARRRRPRRLTPPPGNDDRPAELGWALAA